MWGTRGKCTWAAGSPGAGDRVSNKFLKNTSRSGFFTRCGGHGGAEPDAAAAGEDEALLADETLEDAPHAVRDTSRSKRSAKDSAQSSSEESETDDKVLEEARMMGFDKEDLWDKVRHVEDDLLREEGSSVGS